MSLITRARVESGNIFVPEETQINAAAAAVVDQLVVTVASEAAPTGRARRIRRRQVTVVEEGGDEGLVLELDVDRLGLSPGELLLEDVDLVLELENCSGAAVHGISQPRVRLVHHAAHRVFPLVLRQFLMAHSISKYMERKKAYVTLSWKEGGERDPRYLQEFDDVASAEDTVSGDKLDRITGRKIRREHAFLRGGGASPPQDLASGAWAHHRHRLRGVTN
ncbi:unnamed protein product [Cuscuta campestris]|uniref:Uncharacterized protein n=1 Tax=Cuscuta campestris TaxID=132261 RepID=A0A484LDY6_9ASTE|nr:unnamed protein product [Cuscuta campestris]